MVRKAAPLIFAALVVACPRRRWRGVVGPGLLLLCAAACAAESSQSKTPSGAKEEHPAEWYTIGNARTDFQSQEHEIELAGSDCQAACKALASLERAANHLCAVAEPEECTEARVRVDRAKRAVTSQCGGC